MWIHKLECNDIELNHFHTLLQGGEL
jgi:hypothetical protein